MSLELKSRQLAAFQEELLQNRAEGKPSVLIVDEAHRLSLELLEINFSRFGNTAGKIITNYHCGPTQLTEILQRPDLRQLESSESAVTAS